MRIAIYSSNYGTRMRRAIEQGDEEFVSSIKLFISDDSKTQYMKDFFEERGIQYIYVKYKNRTEFSDSILELLEKNLIEYVFCNGKHILNGELLEKYNNRIVNFHGALLPAYPGVRMLDKMIEKREFLLGVTAMFIDEGIDTGPIIMEAVIPSRSVSKNGYDAVLDLQIEMIHTVYRLLRDNRIKVSGKTVEIEGADYCVHGIFPWVM